MKYRHLFWGVILISIGVLFILNNIGIMHFSWFSFWRLWPIVLLIWGITILPVRDAIKYTMLGVVIVGMFILINRFPVGTPWYRHFHHPDHSYRLEWNSDDEEGAASSVSGNQNLTVPFDSISKRGILNLDAAAGNFVITGNTAEFLAFTKTGDIGNYELTTTQVSGDKKISLKMAEGSAHHNIHKNEVTIRLNEKPSWNLDLNLGAASADFDLSGYKIDTADFQAGASSMIVRLGGKNPKTVLFFNAGASSIHVDVPKTVGCQLTSESFLVSKTLEGFENKGNHIYQTSNFNYSPSKVYIMIKTAVSSVEVKRY